MKKTLFNKFVWIIFGATLVCGAFVFAQDDIWSWMDDLLMDMNFGYNSSTNVRIESISDSKIVIGSDVVEGELWEQIELYVAMYSEHPISSLLDDASKLGDVEEKEFDIGDNNGDGTFMVELDVSSDHIDPDTVYYVSLIPKDDFGMPGDLSKEYCFLVSSNEYGEWDECANLKSSSSSSSNDAGHGAAGPDMELANITETINKENGDVVLKWTSLEGADKIELFYRDERDERFEKLDTVKMSDEIYQFTIDRAGVHNVKFIPLEDWVPVGVEFIHTFNAPTIGTSPNPDPTPNPTPNPGITKVPTVGPKENILMVLIVSVLGYFLYRRVFRRRDS